MQLRDKVALITGAGAGLGRASALLFAAEGAGVAVTDRDLDRAAAVAAEIGESGGRAVALEMDVTDEGQVSRAFAEALSRFGKLDLLFCNAGIPAPFSGFEEQSVSEWRRVLDINVVGTMLCIRTAVPHMRANGGGAILATSSGAALVAVPGQPAYCASKGALNSLTRALALDLGPFNIRVSAICPMGGMSANFVLPADAPIIDEDSLYEAYVPEDSPGPLARPGPPRLVDHARAALFLVSDQAGWCTGVSLPVDGGITIRPQFDREATIRAYERARPRR